MAPPVNLMQTLQQAGFKGPGLARAWAHVMVESGGNPRAFNGNVNTGDKSYGLMQINMLGSLAPARMKQFGLKSEHDLFDPLTNAKAGFLISKGGTDFSAWTGSREDGAKFQGWLKKFPGAASGKGATAGWNDAAAQAFQAGPAGVVAGPSPQDELKFRQQSAAALIQLGNDVVRGGSLGAVSQTMAAIGQARRDLHVAAQKANQSNVGAARYDGSTTDPGPALAPNRQIGAAIQIAKKQIGKPYVWGAENPELGFDCSGLIDYAFKQAGIKIPGRLTTQSALRLGQSVRGMPMKPGDWLITNGGKHMVMYVGNGQVIAAPHKGETVQYQPVSRFANDTVDVRRLSK